ncbi:MAG: carbonic anhydrase [Pseudomonadota bacterium]
MAEDSSTGVKPLPGYLADRYQGWKDGHFSQNKAWYARLAAEGQHPRSMVIQCCDSRINTAAMFGAEPGDLFIVRNVANLVPPYDPDHGHHGTSAAVEYAVNALKVAHIVVVGHSGCGGVHACHDMCSGKAPQLEDASSFIGRWMDILRPGYLKVIDRVSGEAEQKSALELEGVLTSLNNLMTFPFVTKALEDGVLTLHGAWLDIGTGSLHVYDEETGFAPVE